MSDYLCITVQSRPDENTAEFSSRLSRFWTHMLRNYPNDFEKVYAETTAFEAEKGKQTRKYLAEAPVVIVLERELTALEIGFASVDRDDVYTKYEATPPEWMQIEH